MAHSTDARDAAVLLAASAAMCLAQAGIASLLEVDDTWWLSLPLGALALLQSRRDAVWPTLIGAGLLAGSLVATPYRGTLLALLTMNAAMLGLLLVSLSRLLRSRRRASAARAG